MTPTFLLMTALLAQGSSVDTVAVRSELQGLYDEISAANLQFVTAEEVDEFHEVVCTADWMLRDANGQTRAWSEMRQLAIQPLSAPRPESMIQSITKLSADRDGATVVVKVVVIRTITDQEGRASRPGAPHAVTETTMFRDRWVRAGDEWKWKSREELDPRTRTKEGPNNLRDVWEFDRRRFAAIQGRGSLADANGLNCSAEPSASATRW